MAPLSLAGNSIAGGVSASPRNPSKQEPLPSRSPRRQSWHASDAAFVRRPSAELSSLATEAVKGSPLVVRRSSLQLPVSRRPSVTGPPGSLRQSPVNSPSGSCIPSRQGTIEVLSRQGTIEEDAGIHLVDTLRLQSVGRRTDSSPAAVCLHGPGIALPSLDASEVGAAAQEARSSSAPPRRFSTFADALEGTEPEELMQGLLPRPHGPRTAPLRPKDMQRLDAFIIDCDGLLWNPGDCLTTDGDPDEYVRENVAAVNTLIELGNRLVFLDSKAQPSRQVFLERLEHCGVRVDKLGDMPVVTPGLTTSWYLQRQGLKKPFVLTSQASLVADVRTGGLPDCASSIRDEEQASTLFDAKPSTGSFQTLLANMPEVDAVVLGPLGKQEMNAMEAALCVHILRKEGPSAIPVTCCGSQPRRRLKSTAATISCKAMVAFAEGEQPQTFVDMLLPSGLVLAALAGERESGGFGVDFSRAALVGRSLEKTCVFADKCGLASLLIVDNLLDQLEISKETDHRRLPDWVVPSLSRLLTPV